MNWMRSNLAYIPLVVFVFIAYSGGYESIEQWQRAWRTSSVFALAALISMAFMQKHPDRIFLGVNIYLVIGGLMAWLGFGQGVALFGGLLRGVSLFSVILVVGLLTTFFTEAGFVNAVGGDKHIVRKYSLYLVLITLGTIVSAWFFRGTLLYEGTLPFFILYLSYLAFGKQFPQQEPDS